MQTQTVISIPVTLSFMYCTVHSTTYNPLMSVVGLRTTRSLWTASERSTASGTTTGTTGTTEERGGTR